MERRINFTDLSIKNLKPTEKRVEYWDKTFKGGSFGVRVSRNGRKTFVFVYRMNGRLRWMTLGDYPALTVKQARQKVEIARGEVADDKDPLELKKQEREETFEWLSKEYLERYAKVHKKERSRKEDGRILEKYLNPIWGHLPFTAIKRKDVKTLKAEIGIKQKHSVMANRVLALVSKIYNFAIEEEIVSDEFVNPARLVKQFKETSRERVLSDDEIKKLCEALSNRKEETSAVYKLVLLTAQRGGEVKAIQWSQIDEDLIWTMPPGFAKNKLEHKVPLSSQAQKILEELKTESNGSDFVFPSRREKGGSVYWMGKITKRLREKLGFDFTPHDLRRTAATKMSKIGVDDVTIGRILNHAWTRKQITSVYNRYHYLPEMRQALERWGAQLERIVTGKAAKVVKIKSKTA